MKPEKCLNNSHMKENRGFSLWLVLHSLIFSFLLISAFAEAQTNLVIKRAPASTIDTELIDRPEDNPHWLNQLTVEDRKGVLIRMRNQVQAWQREDERAERWDVVPFTSRAATLENRRKFIKRQALKYLDKRLAGELKNADSGSNLYKIAQTKKTLSPSSQFDVAPGFKLKFRAKVLQGRASMLLKNRFFDSEAVVRASGRANFILKRDIKNAGIQAIVDLDAQTGRWSTVINKKIDQNWSTRVSSDQDNEEMAFSKDADTRFEFLFNKPF